MTQATALVGHTGFVGGNLLRQTQFDDLYNSSNIGAIAGGQQELIVDSGASIEKFAGEELSAQLRIALAWSLRERCGGVVVSETATTEIFPGDRDKCTDAGAPSLSASGFSRSRPASTSTFQQSN